MSFSLTRAHIVGRHVCCSSVFKLAEIRCALRLSVRRFKDQSSDVTSAGVVTYQGEICCSAADVAVTQSRQGDAYHAPHPAMDISGVFKHRTAYFL